MQIRGYPVLGTEAAGVMRQAVGLASWLGHSQVTPLHVASTMLSAAGPLRAACLQSQSRPLQCKELELCLNVALNGLAMARQHAPAGTSNSLVAALKRAQAHRRSRCQRQTTALAVNVELAEVTVAILDDPSVDRAMRKAGFSSSQVKACVEKAVSSLELSNSTCSAIDATSPSPVFKNARARQGHLQAVAPEGSLALKLSIIPGSCSHSDGQTSQATPIRTGRPPIIGSTKVLTAASIIPAWLPGYQGPVLNRSTSFGTSLQATGHQRKFTELTAENLKTMCSALEQRVPRHKEIIPCIASTVLRCRSGMTRKVVRPASSVTCLLFLGRDGAGKKAMAQELAKLVFGSTMEFAMVNSDCSMSSSILALKRQRSQDNDNGCFGTRLFNVILENPHRVILIEGADQLDHDSANCIKNAIAEGRARGLKGDVLSLEDTIIVLCSELFDSRSLNSYPCVKQRTSKPDRLKGDNIDEEVRSRHLSLDLNICEEVVEEDLTDDVGIMNDIDGVFLFE